MSSRLKSALVTAVAQYAALAMGVALGYEAARGSLAPFPKPGFLGILAVAALFADAIRFMVRRSRRKPHDETTVLLCLGLLTYAGLIMMTGIPDMETTEVEFVITIHVLLPFLLAIGPLVRSGAWVGVAGSMLFYATVIDILTFNGFSGGCWIGFFTMSVS